VFENRVLRRIFGPKMGYIVRGWKRLHNEELHNFYASPNIITLVESRKMRWVGHIACIGEMINEYKFWSEKLKGRQRGRPRRKWKDNIRMDL
jgi:hypothetical protein